LTMQYDTYTCMYISILYFSKMASATSCSVLSCPVTSMPHADRDMLKTLILWAAFFLLKMVDFTKLTKSIQNLMDTLTQTIKSICASDTEQNTIFKLNKQLYSTLNN
jgi:hypothetical protein